MSDSVCKHCGKSQDMKTPDPLVAAFERKLAALEQEVDLMHELLSKTSAVLGMAMRRIEGARARIPEFPLGEGAELQMPDGCVCDPGTWFGEVPAICESFVAETITVYCKRCEHERGCHKT